MGAFDSYKYEEDNRPRLKPGDYRAVVVSAEETVSKTTCRAMIVVGFNVSGSTATIKNYFVSGEYFNQNVSRFFDAFPSIGDGNFQLIEWIGAEGAVHLREDGDYMRIGWFLKPEQAKDLPPFVGDKPQKQEITDIAAETEDDELPF